MDISAEERWQKSLQAIKQSIPSEQYVAWFEPLQFVSLVDGVLRVGVPTRYFVEYFDKHCAAYLMQVVQGAMGGERLSLKYVVAPAPTVNAAPEPLIQTAATAKTQSVNQRNTFVSPQQQVKPVAFDSQLNPSYRFENFVEGESNRLSRSVALSICENPGKSTFNPFFLYGPSGVGKTHLVNAIGVRIKELYPEKRVLFVSAQVFKTQYTDSVRYNTLNDFINFYQSIEVLIIDDIQGITTSKTQMAFFHVFNHLQQNNRQIILTCDRPPVLFEGIEDRMLTRFKWGIVVEMEKPDTKLRRDILVSKIRRDGLQEAIPADVVQYIAQNVESSVRELEGIVNSLMLYSVVDNCEVDLALTQRVVARAVNLEKKELTPDDILSAVCQHYGVKQKDLVSKSRKQQFALPRQLAMYLVQKYTDTSASQIGRLIGKRDHSTVLHACNKISGLIAADKTFRREVEELESVLK